MKKVLFISLSLILWVHIVGAGFKPEPQNAEEHYKRGNEYFFSGKYDEAIAEFKKVIETNPRDATAHSNLGNAYLLKGIADEAISEYKKAVNINPNYSAAYINLGEAYRRKGMLDEAISTLKKVIEITPNDPVIHSNLKLLYEKKGLKAEAKKETAIHKELTTRKEVKKDLEISNIKSRLDKDGRYHVVGELKNNTTRYAEVIFLMLNCLDKNGKSISRGFATADNIPAGEMAPFGFILTGIKDVASYKVEIDEVFWR